MLRALPVSLALLGLSALPAAAQELQCVATIFTRLVEQETPTKPPHGAIIDTVGALERLSGLSISVRVVPWARALLETTNGDRDCVLGPYKSPEREAALDYIDQPIYRDFHVMVARRDSPPDWNGRIEDLAGRRVVLINGWYYGKALEDALGSFDIAIANSADQGLLMVANNRMEMVALTERDALGGIERLDLGDKLMLLSPPFGSRAGYIALTRAHGLGDIRGRLEQALATLHQSGEQAAILARYGLHIDAASIDPSPVVGAAPSN
jgi:polar amino acid transport system substrate-binding protein